MAKVDSNVEVTIRKARLSFEHIFKAQTPKPDKDGKVGTPTFNCAFLISKKDGKMLDEIEDAIAECKEKMWGKNPPKIRSDRTPLRDGDEYEYEGYEGMMVVSARNQRAPQVVHSKKDEDGAFQKLDGSEGVIYSGCYVNGIVRFWAQDSQDYGKRVNASLEVVQFYSDGDAFSGASKVDANEALRGLEGEVNDDEDPRTSGRRRERDNRRDEDGDRRARRERDEDTDRHERGRDRDEGRSRREPEDRGSSRRPRDDDEDRGRDGGSRDDRSSRDRGGSRGREEERDRPSRDRDRDEDRDGRDSGRGRDRDEDRGSSRSRSEGRSRDDEPSRNSRSSDRDDERSSDRGRSRQEDERDERRGRDDGDRGRDRERSSGSRSSDRDDDRRSSGRRDRDELV